MAKTVTNTITMESGTTHDGKDAVAISCKVHGMIGFLPYPSDMIQMSVDAHLHCKPYICHTCGTTIEGQDYMHDFQDSIICRPCDIKAYRELMEATS
jgi:hypothetical protein